MKRFSYIATDRAGNRAEGTIEAAEWSAALELLAAQGLVDCRQQSAVSLPTLTATDAVELAGYLSELAKSGVPLETLGALAQDASSPSLRKAIDDLSAKLAAGHPLDAALESLGTRLPDHVRRLLVTSARSGRLSEALERLLAQQRQADDMAGRFRQAVMYPAILLALLLGWLVFVTWEVLPQFNRVLEDFETENENWLLDIARGLPFAIVGTLAAVSLVLIAVRVFGGAAGLSRALSLFPLLGPCREYRGLADFSGLLAEFVDEQVPLDESLRLTATGARDPAVRVACRRSAEDVAQGSTLSGSLARQSIFPQTLVRWVQWGESNAALPDALRSAASMFAERFDVRLQLVRVIVPAIVFGLIAASAVFVTASLFYGLFRLITDLAGSSASSGPEAEPAFWAFVGAVCVLAFGTALLVIARVVVVRTSGSAADVTRVLLRYLGWMLIAAAILAVALLIANVWGLLGWILFVFAWVRGAMRYRQSQKQALWAALSLAADKQAPLAPMALAFADEQGGAFAVAARRLAKQLECGASLSEAIAWCPSALPPEAALAARIGTDSGDLAGAVRASRARHTSLMLVSPLVLWLMLFVPSVVFVKVKIEPSLIVIFDDFDSTLPPVTNFVSQVIGSSLFLYFGLALMTLAIVVWLQWRGTLQPRLPGLRKVCRWIELAPVLRMLSLATRHGRPLPQALETIAMWHPTRWVRRRTRAALRDLARGVTWQESLTRRRLLARNDLAVLAAAERNGNLPWALEEMGNSYARRADFQLRAWAEFAFPLLVAAAGASVALFVIAYFLPLVYLINDLSS